VPAHWPGAAQDSADYRAARSHRGHGQHRAAAAGGFGPSGFQGTGKETSSPGLKTSPRSDSGGALHWLRDAPAPAQQSRRRRCPGRDGRGDEPAAADPAPHADLGSGAGDGQPRGYHESRPLEVYFCDPHSPWQRATNENTNGCCANTFRKAPTYLATTATTSSSFAAQLKQQPRKRLGWRTPAEALDQLLSAHNNPPVLRLTG
jgi:hypothetical protein